MMYGDDVCIPAYSSLHMYIYIVVDCEAPQLCAFVVYVLYM